MVGWGEARAAVPAFPGAEGYGAVATGGRGGRVIKVTTLNRTGAGSLQDALNQTGPRIIVFAVSGVIEGNIDIPTGNVTIAGQTAPGAGITIHGHLFAEYSASVQNIIVRHVRVRPTPLTGPSPLGAQYDAIQFSVNSRFILDHVTVSWASDETVDMYEAKNATIQYSTIEESSNRGHPEGAHNYGMINGPDGNRISVHHNLFAHHNRRAPALATGPVESRNNVIYDVAQAFVHHNPAQGGFNIVGNYFKKGPSAALQPFYFDDEEPNSNHPQYFVKDTYIDDPGAFTGAINDPWAEAAKYRGFANMGGANRKVTSEIVFPDLTYKVTTQSAQTAYDLVLEKAGAFPRDGVTKRTIDEVTNRTGSWGAKPPANLMTGLTPGAPPADADNDGMADSWEASQGLSSSDANDNKKLMPSGYTAIEDYINGLADALVGGAPPVVVPGDAGPGPSEDGGTGPGTPGIPGTPGLPGLPSFPNSPEGSAPTADSSAESGCTAAGGPASGSGALLGLSFAALLASAARRRAARR